MPEVEKEETPLTELTKLEATIVSGVTNPANGTPFLVLKARDSSEADGEVAATPPEATQAVKAEADEIEELLTKGICGDDECAACTHTLEGVPGELAQKAKLKAKERNAIPTDQFADPDDRKLPVHDESHTRNAISRFNQTQFSSPGAKRKAGRRIKSAAKRFGIKVGDDANVNKELVEGWDEILKATAKAVGPGVVDGALDTPKQKGKLHRTSGVSETGKSGKAGSTTMVCPHCHGKRSDVDGKAGIACHVCGGKGYVPKKEMSERTNHTPKTVAHTTQGIVKEGDSDFDSDDDCVVIEDDGPAEAKKQKKKNSWITGDNATPGSKNWEDYDSSTLDSVARGLASAAQAVACIQKREQVEAANGNPGDWRDAADLSNAGDSILTALGFVARLAYAEAAEAGSVTKSMRPDVQAALRTARIQLTSLIGDGDTILIDQGEGKMPTTITKTEFDTLLMKAAKKGGKAAFAAMQDADKKKKDKVKKSKTSNNDGEVTEGAIRAKGRRKITAQLGGVPKSGSGKVRKQKKNPEMKALLKSVETLSGQVQAFGQRPRSGGPVLDGVPRGPFPATGRNGKVAKSEEDVKIESLEKELQDTLAKSGPEHAARADYLGQQLTQLKLYKMHAQEGLAH